MPIATATIIEIGVVNKAELPNDSNAVTTMQPAPAVE